jgi:hypothetical protein
MSSNKEAVCKGHRAAGPRGGRPTRFYVGLARGFMDTHLHEKAKAKVVEKDGGGLST